MRTAVAAVVLVVGTAGLGALVGARPAVAGGSTAVRVTGLKVSPKVLPPEGGTFSLTANVANASTCTVTVTPSLAGFPLTTLCTSGANYSKGIILCPPNGSARCAPPPANPSRSAVVYTFSVSASGSGGTAVDPTSVTLTQEAYGWVPTPGPSTSPSPLTDVSCAGAKFCVAVGASGPERLIGKPAMVVEGSQSTSAFRHVSCATATMCLAVGAAGASSYWDGAGWWAQPPIGSGSSGPPPDLASVSCPSTSFCMVIDTLGDAYAVTPSDGGGSATSSGSGLVGAGPIVSCSSSNACLLVDAGGAGASWDGTSWTSLGTIDPSGATALSCSPDGTCNIVDGSGGWLTGTGIPQVPVVPATLPAGLTSITCPAAAYCLATDEAGQAVQEVAGLWSAPVDVTTGIPVVATSCPLSSGAVIGVVVGARCAAVTSKGDGITMHITLAK